MKAYVTTTAVVFALILAAHLARFYFEGSVVLDDAFFVGATIIDVGLLAWAIRLLVVR